MRSRDLWPPPPAAAGAASDSGPGGRCKPPAGSRYDPGCCASSYFRAPSDLAEDAEKICLVCEAVDVSLGAKEPSSSSTCRAIAAVTG